MSMSENTSGPAAGLASSGPDGGGDSAALIVGFVNTRAGGERPDQLGDHRQVADWLVARGLADRAVAVSEADAAAARELRTAFTTILSAHVGCDQTSLADAESYLHRIAERYPVTLRIGAEGVALVPAQSGLPGAFGALLAAVADVAARGIWTRLKVCKNPTCHAGFHDRTRNSSGLYCSTNCSSQVSMRAYRTRLKQA